MPSKTACTDLKSKLGKSIISNENVLNYQYAKDSILIEDSKIIKE